MKPVVPTTHTKLAQYEICPKQFFHRYVLEDTPFVETPALAKGKADHLALERFAKTRIPSPDGMAYAFKMLEPLLDRAIESGGTVDAEQSLAFNADFQPCKWYGVPDILWRAKLDLTCTFGAGDTALVIDYKTGKVKQDALQLERNALTLLINKPTIQRVRPMYWYLVYDQQDPTKVLGVSKVEITADKASPTNWVTREDMPRIMQAMANDIDHVQKAEQMGLWPANPGTPFPCNYCAVKACEYSVVA